MLGLFNSTEIFPPDKPYQISSFCVSHSLGRRSVPGAARDAQPAAAALAAERQQLRQRRFAEQALGSPWSDIVLLCSRMRCRSVTYLLFPTFSEFSCFLHAVS